LAAPDLSEALPCCGANPQAEQPANPDAARTRKADLTGGPLRAETNIGS